MGFFDSLFSKSSRGNSSSPKDDCPISKADLIRQIQSVSIILECFRNTNYLDNVRKARMVRNMSTFKAALVFAYDGVFRFGVAREVISSEEDLLTVANTAASLSPMYFSQDKSRFHSIMEDTLDSWNSHKQSISALSLTDSRVQRELAMVDEISNTFNYLTTC